MTEQLLFAFGDIHGRLDLLQAALNAVDARAAGRAHRLVFLGDYVDRGPDSRGVVELVLELAKEPHVVCLKGNHEALMVQALTSGRASDFRRWMDIGGQPTIESYGASDLETAMAAVPHHHLRWMAALPTTSGDGHRVYVHAGLMPQTPLDRQTEDTCLWIRERFLRAPAQQFDTHVVHGHTPAWDADGGCEPELLAHRTNLDLGAYRTNRLGVGVFDTAAAGGPMELLVASGAPGGVASVSAWTPPAAVAPEAVQTRSPKRERAWAWRL